MKEEYAIITNLAMILKVIAPELHIHQNGHGSESFRGCNHPNCRAAKMALAGCWELHHWIDYEQAFLEIRRVVRGEK